MNIRSLFLLGFLTLSITISGCQTNPSRSDYGTAVGGVLGGVAGAQVDGKYHDAAIIGGALGGAWLGNSVGQNMDDVERLKQENLMLRQQIQQQNTQYYPTCRKILHEIEYKGKVIYGYEKICN